MYDRLSRSLAAAALGVWLGPLAVQAQVPGASARPSAVQAPGDWVLPDSRLGVRTAPLLLLTRPDVQAELRLNTTQVESVRRAVADLWTRAAALRGKTTAEALTARRMIDDAQREALVAVLNDDQRARLDQLDLQWEGASCLVTRSWVASWIGMSPQAQQAFAQHLETELQKAARGAPQEANVRNAVGALMLDELTPEQRVRWTQLTGAEFRFHVFDPQVVPAAATVPNR